LDQSLTQDMSQPNDRAARYALKLSEIWTSTVTGTYTLRLYYKDYGGRAHEMWSQLAGVPNVTFRVVRLNRAGLSYTHGVPVPVDDKHYLIPRDPVDNTKARLVAAPGAGVSARGGELVYKKTAADDLAKGYLAVKPGTTVNGKIDYPVWAAMYPEFISGNDIVFPADVAGMFLRNLGGYAASEGAVQADATDDNGLYTAYAGNHNHHIYYTNGGAGPGFRPSAQDAIGAQLNSMRASYPDMNTTGAHGHSVESNDPETRPVNRAYQLYTIVDSYVATSPMVNGPDLSAYRTLSDQDNIDLQINSTNTQQDTRLNALEAAGGAANTWASSTW